MIDETFLRQSIRDLNDGVNVYIYNDDFIYIMSKAYYEKYDKQLYLEEKKDYYILTTKKRMGTQYEISRKEVEDE